MNYAFGFQTDQEIRKTIDDWFFDLEYLERLRVLLKVYERLNITKIEEQGISKLWNKIDLWRKKEIYQEAWRYQK